MFPELAPDCAACASLCCVALAFDAGGEFAFDKPAGDPCRHLAHHRCTIHGSSEYDGFAGCKAFDCAGAGQRAVALHGGRSWQDDLALLAPLSETFRHLRRLHELIALLHSAGALTLPDAAEAERLALLADLTPAEMSPALAARLATGPLRGKVHSYLRGLSPHLALTARRA